MNEIIEMHDRSQVINAQKVATDRSVGGQVSTLSWSGHHTGRSLVMQWLVIAVAASDRALPQPNALRAQEYADG